MNIYAPNMPNEDLGRQGLIVFQVMVTPSRYWVVNDPRVFNAENETSDQTRRLAWFTRLIDVRMLAR